MNRVEIRKTLIANFSLDELRDLCYQLEVDYESLPAGGKSGKARELVMFAERRERTPDLVLAIANFESVAKTKECEYCGMKPGKCGCGAS